MNQLPCPQESTLLQLQGCCAAKTGGERPKAADEPVSFMDSKALISSFIPPDFVGKGLLRTTFGSQHFSSCSAWDRSPGGRGLDTGGGRQLNDAQGWLQDPAENPDRWGQERVALCGSARLVQQLHSSRDGLAQISQNQLLSPRHADVSCKGLVSAGNHSSQLLMLSSKDNQNH